MTIYQMERASMTPAKIAETIFREVTGWELDSLNASEFSYCYDCLEHELEVLQADIEADRVIAELMRGLLNRPCARCDHPWGQHDRLCEGQPCVNRLRVVAPFDCPCPGFTRPAADFSEPTFTVPGPLELERPGARIGHKVSCHDHRWPR